MATVRACVRACCRARREAEAEADSQSSGDETVSSPLKRWVGEGGEKRNNVGTWNVNEM